MQTEIPLQHRRKHRKHDVTRRTKPTQQQATVPVIGLYLADCAIVSHIIHKIFACGALSEQNTLSLQIVDTRKLLTVSYIFVEYDRKAAYSVFGPSLM